jgi:hypothetical protein
VSSVAHRGLVHVGMDVSKDSIVVAVLSPDRDAAEVDKIFNDEESVRRLVKRLGRPSGLWAARPQLTPQCSPHKSNFECFRPLSSHPSDCVHHGVPRNTPTARRRDRRTGRGGRVASGLGRPSTVRQRS